MFGPKIGIGLDAVPPYFGWELVIWKPLNERFREEIEGKPVEVFGEVHEVVEIGDETSEEEKIDLELGTGHMPVHGVGGGDSILEDYPGYSFENVGEINLEEDPQTPSEPVLSVPSDETLTSAEPRRKRVKTFAGRTDLPWVWKLLAQRSKASPASHQPSSQASQPTRKPHRLAAQGFVRRSSTTNQETPMIEEIESSPEGSPIKNPETPATPQDLPVLESEQPSTETSSLSKQTPTTRPILKRKVTSKQDPAPKPAKESSSKRAKTSVTPSPKLEKFLKRGVVRDKIVKIGYFQEQGLEVFLDKLRDQGGWSSLQTPRLGVSNQT